MGKLSIIIDMLNARLLKHFQRVRPALYATKDFFLLHDICLPSHRGISAAVLGLEIRFCAAPPSLFTVSVPARLSFQRLKLLVKGQRFEDIPTIERNVTAALKTILRTDFERTLRRLEACAQRGVDSNGMYF